MNSNCRTSRDRLTPTYSGEGRFLSLGSCRTTLWSKTLFTGRRDPRNDLSFGVKRSYIFFINKYGVFLNSVDKKILVGKG